MLRGGTRNPMRKWARDLAKRLVAKVSVAISVVVRMALAGVFWLASVLAHRIHISGLEHDDGARSTYFALAHKRDQDPFIVLPPLLAHRGWAALAGDVHFALRSDAFAAGFLARISPHPRWLAWLLRQLNLSAILRGLGAYPIQALQQPAEAWIRAVRDKEGDRPAGDTLAPWFLTEVAASAGESVQVVGGKPLSRLLAWRYQPYMQRFQGAGIFLPPLRRTAERLALTSAKRYVANLSTWLSAGGSLLGAPAGQLSPDGRLGTRFAGLHRLLRSAPPETRIVPVCITYDFMSTGRPSVFIDVAPAIPAFGSLTPEQRAVALLDAWRRSAHFTCSQLGAGFLVELGRSAPTEFTFEQIVTKVRMHAARLAADGRRVDPALLDSRASRRLIARFLRYCERHGLVQRRHRDAWTATIGDMVMYVRPGEVGFRLYPLAYAWNELRDLLGEAAIPSGIYQRSETHG